MRYIFIHLDGVEKQLNYICRKKMLNSKVQNIIERQKVLKDLSQAVKFKINLLVKWFKI